MTETAAAPAQLGVRDLATPTSRSVQRGLVVLRWATFAWCVAVVVMSRERLERPWVAVALLTAAGVITVFTTVQAARGWAPTTASVLAELAVDVALIIGDGYAFMEGTARNGHQSLAGQFPIVGVVNAGFVLGVWVGLSAGAVVGFSNTVSVWINGFRDFEGDDLASLGSSVCFFALWGGVAGWVGQLLARAEQEVATTRAREEVAATLHDGVLQTLALVERRTEASAPELARLARETDRDLRAFLWEKPDRTDGRADLATEVREAALRAGRSWTTRSWSRPVRPPRSPGP
jgi:signal transduction histidine kinase